jgi:beta-glucosidase
MLHHCLNRLRVAQSAPLLAAAMTVAGSMTLAVPAAQAIPLQSAIVADSNLVDQRVEALLKQMTLQEKIGQLTQIGPEPVEPENITAEDLIRSGRAGSVLWTIDTALIQKYQKIAVEESRLKIPLLFGFDVIHGYKNVFPMPIGMAATWDPALVERAQAIAAHEAAVSGINWSFAPMVDIARDPRWGRIAEGAGEDPYLGAAIARAQTLGLQGPKLGTPNRVLASVKHFAGYGAADGGRDYDSCYIPETTFRNTYLKPFQAAFDAGVGAAMCGYMVLNDVPCSGNSWLLRDVLRTDMGFTGFVISDAWSVNSLTPHGFSRDGADAAFRGLRSGVDMDMGSLTYQQFLAKAVESGKLPIALVDQSVRNVLAVKIRMGLFEKPYADLDQRDAVFNDPASRAATREAAQRSIVLLRNQNDLLPLKRSLKTIALIGPLGDSTEDIKGSWTVEGGAAVSLLEGLRAKLPRTHVGFVRGGDMQRPYAMPWDAIKGKKAPEIMSPEEMKLEVAKAVEAANKSELVILALGERAGMSGEAASVSDLRLQGNQQELLEAVVATGKPVVLVLFGGRPFDITWAANQVPAILTAWFPGTEGGNAIADVLFGEYNPGGKLPVSWPRSTGHLPYYYNHPLTHSPEADPLFTSRYAANTTSAPLYPFGYGLSYTNFSFSNLVLDRTSLKAVEQSKAATAAAVANLNPVATTLKDGEQIKVSVVVENTGKVAGDEVAQLYIHQKAGSIVRPVRELKGFQRINLAPGEKKTVTFTLARAELEFWSPHTRTWVVEPEQFDIWVGNNCQATLHSQFEIVP